MKQQVNKRRKASPNKKKHVKRQLRKLLVHKYISLLYGLGFRI